ncbi:MAG: hypothetical protein Q9228_007852 [Teloschistes exilis]
MSYNIAGMAIKNEYLYVNVGRALSVPKLIYASLSRDDCLRSMCPECLQRTFPAAISTSRDTAP